MGIIQKLWLFVVVISVLLFVINKFNPKDDSDPFDGRSGFRIMTDNLTGCQYLQAGYFGGMTPRLDRNNKHICK